MLKAAAARCRIRSAWSLIRHWSWWTARVVGSGKGIRRIWPKSNASSALAESAPRFRNLLIPIGVNVAAFFRRSQLQTRQVRIEAAADPAFGEHGFQRLDRVQHGDAGVDRRHLFADR